MRDRRPVHTHADTAGPSRRPARRIVLGVLLGLAAMLVPAACSADKTGTHANGSIGGGAGASPTPKQSAGPDPVTRPPAKAAGGACKLLDYSQVKTAVGTDFHVAVSRARGDTQTCVLQVLNTAYPDLILTLAPTRADPKVFQSAVVPKGAQAVPQLGKAAYSTVVAPTNAAGAAVEVGWLGSGGRIVTIRYTHQTGTKSEAAGKKTSAVVALARKLEAAR